MNLDLGRFRNEAYTGSNRCWKCTTVNVIILAGLVGAVAVVSSGAAVLVGVAGIVAVVTRGYLVPFTPMFAPALVDALPGGSLFEPTHDSISDTDERTAPAGLDGKTVLKLLLEHGVLTERGDELFVDETFRRRWRAVVRRLRESDDLVGTIDAAVPPTSTVRPATDGEDGDLYITDEDPDSYGQIVSRSVALADAAAVESLREPIPEADRETRLFAAQSLRMFLETCPECDGELTRDIRSDGCCGGGPFRETLVCAECDTELFVFGPA